VIQLLCNRCNTILEKPSYCPRCGCPEYRIEGLTPEELTELNGKQTRNKQAAEAAGGGK